MSYPIKIECEVNITEDTVDIKEAPTHFTSFQNDLVYQKSELNEEKQMIHVKNEEAEEIMDSHEPVNWEPTMDGDEISCYICNQSFKTVELLNYHYTVHGDSLIDDSEQYIFIKNEACDTVDETKNPNSCKICPKSFDNLRGLSQHMRSHKVKSSDEHVVKCEICSKRIATKNYSQHLFKKHKNSVKTKSCKLCQKSFLGQLLLDRHYRLKHCRPCNECEIMFRSQKELHRHIKAVHFIKDPTHRAQCNKCGLRFEPENSDAHLVICNSSKRMKYLFICYICKKLFQTENALIIHMPSHEKGSYECDICSRTYPALIKLKTHLLTTHFKRTPVIKCTHCPETFSKIKLRSQHILKCHKKDQYTCDTCNKVFRNEKILKRHKEELHTSSKNFKCEVCQAEFNRKHNLVHHQLVHFKYPFPCTICSKMCKTEEELQKHKNQHSDPNFFECKVCFFIFARKNIMEHHYEIKHGKQERFSCHYCGKQFAYKNGLQIHLDNYLIKRDCNVRKKYKLKKKNKC